MAGTEEAPHLVLVAAEPGRRRDLFPSPEAPGHRLFQGIGSLGERLGGIVALGDRGRSEKLTTNPPSAASSVTTTGKEKSRIDSSLLGLQVVRRKAELLEHGA